LKKLSRRARSAAFSLALQSVRRIGKAWIRSRIGQLPRLPMPVSGHFKSIRRIPHFDRGTPSMAILFCL
jgi:hypothetical protein